MLDKVFLDCAVEVGLARVARSIRQMEFGLPGLGLPVTVVLTGGKLSDVKGNAPVMDESGPQPKAPGRQG